MRVFSSRRLGSSVGSSDFASSSVCNLFLSFLSFLRLCVLSFLSCFGFFSFLQFLAPSNSSVSAISVYNGVVKPLGARLRTRNVCISQSAFVTEKECWSNSSVFSLAEAWVKLKQFKYNLVLVFMHVHTLYPCMRAFVQTTGRLTLSEAQPQNWTEGQ